MTAPLSTTWAAVPARLIRPAVIADSCTRSSGFVRSETASKTPSEVTTAARRTSGTRWAKPARSRSRSCWSSAGSWVPSSAIPARLLRAAAHLGRCPGPAGPSLEAGELAPRDLCRLGGSLRRLAVDRGAVNLAGLRHTLRQPRGSRAAHRRRPGYGALPVLAIRRGRPGCGTSAAGSPGRRPIGRRPCLRRLAGLWIAGPQTLAVAGFDGLEYGQHVVWLRARRFSHGHAGGGLWLRGRHRSAQQQRDGLGRAGLRLWRADLRLWRAGLRLQGRFRSGGEPESGERQIRGRDPGVGFP